MEVGEQALNHRKAVAGLNHQVHRARMGRQHAAMEPGHGLEAAHTGGAHGDHPAATRPALRNGGHQLGGHLGSCQERCHLLEAFYASFAKVTRGLFCWVANGSLIHSKSGCFQ